MDVTNSSIIRKSLIEMETFASVRRACRETERRNPDSSVVRAPAYVHMEMEA